MAEFKFSCFSFRVRVLLTLLTVEVSWFTGASECNRAVAIVSNNTCACVQKRLLLKKASNTQFLSFFPHLRPECSQ